MSMFGRDQHNTEAIITQLEINFKKLKKRLKLFFCVCFYVLFVWKVLQAY